MTRHDCLSCGAPIKTWLRECEYCGRGYGANPTLSNKKLSDAYHQHVINLYNAQMASANQLKRVRYILGGLLG